MCSPVNSLNGLQVWRWNSETSRRGCLSLSVGILYYPDLLVAVVFQSILLTPLKLHLREGRWIRVLCFELIFKKTNSFPNHHKILLSTVQTMAVIREAICLNTSASPSQYNWPVLTGTSARQVPLVVTPAIPSLDTQQIGTRENLVFTGEQFQPVLVDVGMALQEGDTSDIPAQHCILYC